MGRALPGLPAGNLSDSTPTPGPAGTPGGGQGSELRQASGGQASGTARWQV